MSKRGQLTIFIIVAIIIITLVAIFFFVIELPKATRGAYADAIYNFVDECIEETAEDAIYEIGQNGGYYFPSSTSTSTGIAYYYENGKNLMPAEEKIENQISLFIERNLFFCTKNFVQFNNANISQGEINVDTTIFNDKVKIEVNYPITITQDEDSSVIEDFKKEIYVRLGLIYDLIAEVLNATEQGICMSCLYGVAVENDFYVEMLDYDENTVIVIFIDKNSEINKEDYEYVYAVEI